MSAILGLYAERACRALAVLIGDLYIAGNFREDAVIHNVGKYLISLPVDHPLPDYQSTECLYDRGYIPLLRKYFEMRSGGWIVDIGANIGGTACLIASLTDRPIICVEGEELYFEYLKKNTSQLPNDVILCDRFIYDTVIEEKSLFYAAARGTGKFSSNQNTPRKQASFISLSEVLRLSNGDICLFKSDTDGLDIAIVKQYLATGRAKDTLIFMEFDPNYEITSRAEVSLFLKSLVESSHIAVFTNKGAPLAFMETPDASVIEDIFRHVEFSKASREPPFHYLDLFVFPNSYSSVFRQIVAEYRGLHVT